MDPSLDECNDIIDWIDEMFGVRRNLRIRIRDENGVYYLKLLWSVQKRPGAEDLFSPVGWVLTKWSMNEDGLWEADLFRI